ncbi:MAG: hypothetical protein QCI82_03185 [Candidatus Thermoplasmatota archaeon]|nr:hypothetical protein [Candidatus Thermoplasmatota archaeon]
MNRFAVSVLVITLLCGSAMGLDNDSMENAQKIFVGVTEGEVEESEEWYSLDVHPYMKFTITFELLGEGSIRAYGGYDQEDDPFFTFVLDSEGDRESYEHINEGTSSKELFLMVSGTGPFSITVNIGPGLDSACCCGGAIFLGLGGLAAAFLVLRRRK